MEGVVCGAEADCVDRGEEAVYLEEEFGGEGLERGELDVGGSGGLRRL